MIKKDEQKMEEIKDSFLQVASHQLKMPLNAIRMNLEMVLSGDLGKINNKIKANITEAIRINTKALELVSDYLNASSIENSAASAKAKEIDLIESITEAIAETKLLAKQRKVKVKLIILPKGLKSLKAKAKNFDEVVKNLLSNAIKYNRVGGTVTIELHKRDGSAEVKIQDTGIGIPKKDQDKMFGKFFRAGNAKSRATEGSGLGLFIVKSYVESWGGKIAFSSIENKGTTFIVDLPIK